AIESQLGGALIVDPRGDVSTDRVFVMTQWDDTRIRVDELVTPEARRVFAINGFSWPHTERLDEQVGQSTRWRIVNLTQVGHPMHLHGFYFTVQAVGTGLADTVYEPGAYRQVVTERMAPGGTMQLAWTPERVGNWLFHCHLVSHVTPALRFWLPQEHTSGHHGPQGVHDVKTGMAGLVMGIRRPRQAGAPPPPPPPPPTR